MASPPCFLDAKTGKASLMLCDSGENDPSMETMGATAERGFTIAEICAIAHKFPGSRLVDLSFPANGCEAGVVVIPGGVDAVAGSGAADAIHRRLCEIKFDVQKSKQRKDGTSIVQFKRQRGNACVADFSQVADIPAGKGTVLNFADEPEMARFRSGVHASFGEPATWAKVAELNFYQPHSGNQTPGIGWHGDAERRIVICARFGPDQDPIRFQWHHRHLPISEEIEVPLNHGDVYVMCAKAVGHDAHCPSLRTLQHAVGRGVPKRPIGEPTARMVASAKARERKRKAQDALNH